MSWDYYWPITVSWDYLNPICLLYFVGFNKKKRIGIERQDEEENLHSNSIQISFHCLKQTHLYSKSNFNFCANSNSITIHKTNANLNSVSDSFI
ncbi:hypothetical protein HanPSC8_Chr17g0784081 [Helianthus annuus]|nr:hypothetical protein HanPSC8_Chr17g0784081 [Helianthus annuus]